MRMTSTRTVRHAREDLVSRATGRLTSHGAHAQSDFCERILQVERLVGHQGTQRIHEHARNAPHDSRARRVHMEDERFPAARRHHDERTAPIGKVLEGAHLRGMHRVLANEVADEFAIERFWRERRKVRPARCACKRDCGVRDESVLTGNEDVDAQTLPRCPAGNICHHDVVLDSRVDIGGERRGKPAVEVAHLFTEGIEERARIGVILVVRLTLKSERRVRHEPGNHVLTTLERHAGELRVERGGFPDSRIVATGENLIGVCKQVVDEISCGGIGRSGTHPHVARHEL